MSQSKSSQMTLFLNGCPGNSVAYDGISDILITEIIKKVSNDTCLMDVQEKC